MDGNNTGFTCSLKNLLFLCNTNTLTPFFHYSDLMNDYDE